MQRDYEKIIADLEAKGLYDNDVLYVNPRFVAPVGDDYNYGRKNSFFRCYSVFVRIVLWLLMPLISKMLYHTVVKGRKNLRHLKRGITVSNHVLKTDCIVMMDALWGKRKYFTVAPHNNKKGFQKTFKAAGVIPFGTTLLTMKNFRTIVDDLLKRDSLVHFYPEQGMWPFYTKIRPFKRGAFYYAAGNEVPIVPILIAFRRPNHWERITGRKKIVTVFIDKPIYPNKNLDRNENEDFLMEQTCQAFQKMHHDFYNNAEAK